MSDNGQVIDRYFAAMRRGGAAEEELMSLFADDAVYIEPFSGEPGPWVGKEAVRAALRRGWEQPLPDLELDVTRVEINADGASSEWVCRSPALPGPVTGRDDYTIVDGMITRLEVRIVEP